MCARLWIEPSEFEPWLPGWGHCVVFLGKTLYSHSASPPRCTLGTGKINAGGDPAMD